MSYLEAIADCLEPVNLFALSNDEGYIDTQLGKHIDVNDQYLPDLQHADIIIVGCNEVRGAVQGSYSAIAADSVRREFFQLFHWHKDVQVSDVGNVKTGATLQDTYAALKTVVSTLLENNKRVVILGGSHDLTLSQYR